MQLACPACGKTNDTVQGDSCQRCGCDLSPLTAIRQAAGWHLRTAANQLRAQAWADALRQAESSWALRRSSAAAQVAFLAAAALGDTAQLLHWREQATPSAHE